MSMRSDSSEENSPSKQSATHKHSGLEDHLEVTLMRCDSLSLAVHQKEKELAELRLFAQEEREHLMSAMLEEKRDRESMNSKLTQIQEENLRLQSELELLKSKNEKAPLQPARSVERENVLNILQELRVFKPSPNSSQATSSRNKDTMRKALQTVSIVDNYSLCDM